MLRRLLIIAIFALGTLLFFNVSARKQAILWTRQLVNKQTLTLQKESTEAVNKTSQKAVLGVSDYAKQNVAQIAQNVVQIIDQKSRAALGLPSSNSEKAILLTQVTDVPEKSTQNTIFLDYQNANGQNLSFALNTDYFLDIRNAPENECLFVDNRPLKIKPNEYLRVRFTESGIFKYTFEACEKTTPPAGQIVVK
jgi:hypothetical protein